MSTFIAKQAELLIRLGLVPVKDLTFVTRALTHIRNDVFLPFNERQAFYTFIEKLMDMAFNDPTIFRLLRQKVTMSRYEEIDPINEVQLDLKRTPEGMLDTLSGNVRAKARAGGKVSPTEKKLASRAKAELRRRRDNTSHQMKYRAKKKVVKENYETVLLQVMNDFGVQNIADLPKESVKEFFNKVEHLYNSGE